MGQSSADPNSRNEGIAAVPLIMWFVSQLFNYIEGTFTLRKALITLVVACIFSLIIYTVFRSVANYRGSMRK